MVKNIWIYVSLVAALGVVGGGIYLYAHQASSTQVIEPAPPTEASSTAPSPSEKDDEVKRKTLEGIGTIKNLKPVQIQPTQR